MQKWWIARRLSGDCLDGIVDAMRSNFSNSMQSEDGGRRLRHKMPSADAAATQSVASNAGGNYARVAVGISKILAQLVPLADENVVSDASPSRLMQSAAHFTQIAYNMSSTSTPMPFGEDKQVASCISLFLLGALMRSLSRKGAGSRGADVTASPASMMPVLLPKDVQARVGLDAIKLIERGCGQHRQLMSSREVACRPAAATLIFVSLVLLRGGDAFWRHFLGPRSKELRTCCTRTVIRDILQHLLPHVERECFANASPGNEISAREQETAKASEAVRDAGAHVAFIVCELASRLASVLPCGYHMVPFLELEMRLLRRAEMEGEFACSSCPKLVAASCTDPEALASLLACAAQHGYFTFFNEVIEELSKLPQRRVRVRSACVALCALADAFVAAMETRQKGTLVEAGNRAVSDASAADSAHFDAMYVTGCRLYASSIGDGGADETVSQGQFVRVLSVFEHFASWRAQQTQGSQLTDAYVNLVGDCCRTVADGSVQSEEREEEEGGDNQTGDEDDDESGYWEIDGSFPGQLTPQRDAAGAAAGRRAKNSKTPKKRNAFIAAALRERRKEYDQSDDFSDLEDFLVCKPGRDYSDFFQRAEKKRRRRSKM